MLFFKTLYLILCLFFIVEIFCQANSPQGKPLFLTPFIKRGQLVKGREKAKVPFVADGKNVESYAGYLTVNSKYYSNLYFWFFPAEYDSSTAPVALWLQGGPGGSSLYGLFKESGPFIINSNLTLSRRQFHWSTNTNMIYIDNPVGTGFSFTRHDAGYATDEKEVAKNLYLALMQFFRLFPHYGKNDFFITGESYAGKYIPSLGYAIHVKNRKSHAKINLKGIAIGDGWIDPVHMMVYSDYLYQLGLLDRLSQEKMKTVEQSAVNLIQEKKYRQAYDKWNDIFGILSDSAGDVDVYDYLSLSSFDWPDNVTRAFFDNPSVRRNMHVGKQPFHDGSKVYAKLLKDMPKSVAPWLEALMDHYKVLLYNGQLDIIVAYPLTTNFVLQLQWSGAEQFANTSRQEWIVGGELAGYYTQLGNFTQAMVRKAGHMVPTQQPYWAWEMITRFTRGMPFSG